MAAASLIKKLRDAAGKNALDWACEFGYDSICKLLLERGFCSKKPRSKAQLLRRACQEGDKMLDLFFDAWKNELKNMDRRGRTVLQVAREKRYVDVVEKLLRNFTLEQLGEKETTKVQI